MKVMIEIQGGLLTAVTTDGEEVEVLLKDWDNTEDPALPFDVETVSSEDLDALVEKYSDTDEEPGLS